MNGKGSKALSGIGLTIIRVVVGIVFAAHGAQKLMTGFDQVSAQFVAYGIPMPLAAAILVTLVEILFGLALLVGLKTRLAAVPLAVDMVVALLKVHLPHGFFGPGGIEYPLVLLAVLVALMLMGAGPVSIDRISARRHADAEQSQPPSES